MTYEQLRGELLDADQDTDRLNVVRAKVLEAIAASTTSEERDQLELLLVVPTNNGPEPGDTADQTPEPDVE